MWRQWTAQRLGSGPVCRSLWEFKQTMRDNFKDKKQAAADNNWQPSTPSAASTPISVVWLKLQRGHSVRLSARLAGTQSVQRWRTEHSSQRRRGNHEVRISNAPVPWRHVSYGCFRAVSEYDSLASLHRSSCSVSWTSKHPRLQIIFLSSVVVHRQRREHHDYTTQEHLA